MSTFESDLRILCKALNTRKDPYRQFEGKLELAVSTEGAQRDIRRGLRNLEMIRDRYITMSAPIEHSQSDEHAQIGGALFFQAIMLYVRATDGTSKLRRPSGISDKLGTDWKQLHRRAIGLRNDALAHVSGGGDRWQNETIVGTLSPSESRLRTPVSYFNYRADEVLEYINLFNAALEVCPAVLKKRLDVLIEALCKLFATDAAFRTAYLASEFDPKAFFGTETGTAIWKERSARGEHGAWNITALRDTLLRERDDTA